MHYAIRQAQKGYGSQPVQRKPFLKKTKLALLATVVTASISQVNAQTIPAATQQALASPERFGKLGTRLGIIQSGGGGASVPSPNDSIDANLVVIDAIAKDDASVLLEDLTALGLLNGSAFGRVVSGRLPLPALNTVGTLDSLQFIRMARARTQVGSVNTQGDHAMGSDIARLILPVDGSGVSIGVLSDSYDQLSGENADIASGDLPSDVIILDDSAGGTNSDEGRAMAQLIHDVAPGAQLLFHTAFNGQADFAQGIIDLANAGADVIVDDVFYFAEPMFQDGIIAQAVDEAVEDLGSVYFSSAGNSGNRSYEANYDSSGQTFPTPFGFTLNDLHDFDSGPGVDTSLDFTLPSGGSITLALQWDQPFASAGGAGATTDIDILITDATGTIVALSADGNIGSDASEVVQFTNFSSSTDFTAVVGIFSGAVPGKLKFIDYGASAVFSTGVLNASTVSGHANAAGAIATGAAFYVDTPPFGTIPPLLEPFSSIGGLEILFDTDGNPISPVDRNKPDIVGPDGTNTTFFVGGPDVENDGFPNFFGTSAAAPHAAAVAALQLQCDPMLTNDDIRAQMASTAEDMESPGFDNNSGPGFIDALDAVIIACTVPVAVCNGLPVDVFIGNGDTPTTGDDVILGTEGVDIINSLAGNDTICALGGNDIINSGGGNDWIDAGPGNDQVLASAGDDTVFGGTGDDEILAGSGDDDVEGEEGDDTIFGQPGNDTLDGGDGVDAINGGGGSDTIFTGPGATVGTGKFVTGNVGNDTITGGPDADDLRGSNGLDTINGGGGDDVMSGGDGRDTINGGAGDDEIRGQNGVDLLIGGSGDDFISGGNDIDTINGGPGADEIIGGPGNDILNGDGGSDDIEGGSGDDDMIGGPGSGDSCNGQSGTDTADVSCETVVGVP